jgi:hypothetical protein
MSRAVLISKISNALAARGLEPVISIEDLRKKHPGISDAYRSTLTLAKLRCLLADLESGREFPPPERGKAGGVRKALLSDDEIYRLCQDGEPQTSVARKAGIGRARVSQIVQYMKLANDRSLP